jgi:hypothetical protein
MNQPRRRAIVARHVSFVLAAAVVVCVQATVCLSDGAESICEHPVVKHAFLQSMMCENPSALNCAEQGIPTAKALKSMTDGAHVEWSVQLGGRFVSSSHD